MRVDGDDPSGRRKLALTVAMCRHCEWVLRDAGVTNADMAEAFAAINPC